VTLQGVCCDALNPAGAPPVDQLGAMEIVRLVAFDSGVFYAYHHELQAAGLKTAVVIAQETFGSFGLLEETVKRIARRCTPTYWIVGNEMDAGALSEESHASMTQSVDQYVTYFGAVSRAVRSVQPFAHLVVGGSVSGQPDVWVEYIESLERSGYQLSGADIHPYAKGASEAATLLQAYRALRPQLAQFVLEWNREASEMLDYVRMLDEERVTAAAFFAWHTVDVPGLMDPSGQPTARYRAYLAALAARPFAGSLPVDTTPIGGVEMPDFVWGFKSYHDQHPEIGAAVTDEGPVGNVQETEHGLLVYLRGANKVVYLPKA
jgi:hypothetical protein